MDRIVKVLAEANAMLGGLWPDKNKTWIVGYTAPWRTLRLYVGVTSDRDSAALVFSIWSSTDGVTFFQVGDSVSMVLDRNLMGVTIERTVGSYTQIRINNDAMTALIVQAELAN